MSISHSATPRVSGEGGMWLLLLGDMVIYALLLCFYAYDHSRSLEVFQAAQGTLSQFYGIANTLILLTSSWLVVMALQAARTSDFDGRSKASRLLLWAMVCGAAFGALKFIEYGQKINAGIEITDNGFYMYYFLLTGFHFVHVLIGMTALFFMRRHIANNPQVDQAILESGANFWHLVDMLWILIFPIIYLIG